MTALRRPDPIEQEVVALRAEVAALRSDHARRLERLEILARGQIAERIAGGGLNGWLTPKQVAADFRISRSTVRRWVMAGTVTAMRVGGHFLIDAGSVPRGKSGAF
jgi:excisionase family DNA binding protein